MLHTHTHTQLHTFILLLFFICLFNICIGSFTNPPRLPSNGIHSGTNQVITQPGRVPIIVGPNSAEASTNQPTIGACQLLTCDFECKTQLCFCKFYNIRSWNMRLHTGWLLWHNILGTATN